MSSDINPFLAIEPFVKSSKLVNTLQFFVIISTVIMVIYLFIAIPNEVSGRSMEPNFHDGEFFLTDKTIAVLGKNIFSSYDYKRGDVITFKRPNETDYIKRIIGIPGDVVVIRNDDIYINNNKIKEEYIPLSTSTKAKTFFLINESRVVPDGYYFVLGDNRENSKDSRFDEVGFVKRDIIHGRVFFRFWPFNKIAIISTGKIENLN